MPAPFAFPAVRLRCSPRLGGCCSCSSTSSRTLAQPARSCCDRWPSAHWCTTVGTLCGCCSTYYQPTCCARSSSVADCHQPSASIPRAGQAAVVNTHIHTKTVTTNTCRNLKPPPPPPAALHPVHHFMRFSNLDSPVFTKFRCPVYERNPRKATKQKKNEHFQFLCNKVP